MISSASVRRRVRPRSSTWSVAPPARVGFILTTPMLIGIVALVAYPLVSLVIVSLTSNSRYPGGLQNYITLFNSSADMRALRTTLTVSALVTVASMTIGSILAWVLVTARSRLVRAIVWLATLTPFWMGVIVKNYAIMIVLAPDGLINRALESIGLISKPITLLNTIPAVVAGMLYTMIPWATLPLYAVFRTIHLDLIHAAESLGCYRAKAIVQIVPPLTLPGLLATSIIVYVYCIGFYITPVLLGGITSPFVPSLIGLEVFNYFDLVGASCAGVLLIVVAFLILGLGARLVGQQRLARAIARSL